MFHGTKNNSIMCSACSNILKPSNMVRNVISYHFMPFYVRVVQKKVKTYLCNYKCATFTGLIFVLDL